VVNGSIVAAPTCGVNRHPSLFLTRLSPLSTLGAISRVGYLVDSERPKADREDRDALWRGIDLSGNTVVIGVGEGRLIETLAHQASAACGGQVVAIGFRTNELASLRERLDHLSVGYVNFRPRALPFQDGAIDLIVMNGSLRQIPVGAQRALFEEIWRTLVPGGQLRIADILEPSEAPYNEAWRQRNALISRIATALGRPTALYANLKAAAEILTAVGFEQLAVSILPGYPLTEAWLDATEEATMAMASRLVDQELRKEVLEVALVRLIKTFRSGEQRAAERFVLRGVKIGTLSLDMEASFTEDDLAGQDDA
jgi:SAM-dependent methyltransferase